MINIEDYSLQMSKSISQKKLISLIPFFIRNPLKKIYVAFRNAYNISVGINKGKGISLAEGFRIDRGKSTFNAIIGAYTHVDAYNIWSLHSGNISVGTNSWIGLHNILMGPLKIGDNFSTGPHVKILGPRHAVYGFEHQNRNETVIGNNVTITTGSIIFFGIHIGDGAIIGPGSVVTKDVKPGAFVFGNPARDLTKMVNFERN